MERLTVDNPRNNRETLLNYAYENDGRVYLSYADGEGGVDLCEYIAKNACCEEVDAEAIMDGACMECDNKTALLYIVSVQAAELRARLAHYEDLEEQGRLVVLPVPVGSTVYALFCGEVVEKRIGKFHVNSYTEPQIWAELDCVYLASQTVRWDMAVGKTVFLTRAEAEAALAASDAKGG